MEGDAVKGGCRKGTHSGQQAGGAHPTGMLSCFNVNLGWTLIGRMGSESVKVPTTIETMLNGHRNAKVTCKWTLKSLIYNICR